MIIDSFDKGICPFDAFEQWSLRDCLSIGFITINLRSVKDARRPGNEAFACIALFVVLINPDRFVEDNQRGFLSLANLTTGILLLMVGAPDVGSEVGYCQVV